MAEKTENKDISAPESPNSENPMRTGAGGILILIVVCTILWALFTFGPKGADWLTAVTQDVFGLNEPASPVVENVEKTTEPEQKTDPEEPPAPEPVAKQQSSGNPVIDNARRQILEALGGPENAVIRHIAVSRDENSLVAAVQLLGKGDKSEIMEIYFDKDDFGRYISAPDSPVGKEIKIWTE